MEKVETKYYHSLYKVAAEINSARDSELVLKSIVENVAKSMGAKACSLTLLAPERKLLFHAVAWGLSDWFVKMGPLSAVKSIPETLEGKAVAILDATSDKRIQYPEQVKKEGIASILSVPMMLRDEIIGEVRVYTAEQRQFSKDDIYFVTAAANLGAIALENAKLYEAVHKDYEAVMHEMLEWRSYLEA
ncbi:MAG: GAF domain-containing protein [Dehalococcoidales bacterium]|nr:GAF domain-containing protein [Dehalococcoidales bacterium]